MGERRAECRCLRNKTITGSAISLLEESGVRGPVRRSPGYSLFLWYVVLLNKGGDTYERLHEGPAPAVFLGTGASQPVPDLCGCHEGQQSDPVVEEDDKR